MAFANRITQSVILAALLFGCGVFKAPSIRKDNSVPLAEYRTYQWISQADVKELRLDNPAIDYLSASVRVVRNEKNEERLKSIIDESLRKQGYVKSTDAPPDFYVTYYAKAKNEDWISTWTGFTASTGGVPVVIFPEYDRRGARSYHDGIVYLTMYDAETKRASWTGSASRAAFERGFEGPELYTAVDDLTESFKESATG